MGCNNSSIKTLGAVGRRRSFQEKMIEKSIVESSNLTDKERQEAFEKGESILTVRVLGARNLPIMKLNSSERDAYCTIELVGGDEVPYNEVLFRKNCRAVGESILPAWLDAELSIIVSKLLASKLKRIRVVIHDSDSPDEDDVLGEVTLVPESAGLKSERFVELKDGQETNCWLPLFKHGQEVEYTSAAESHADELLAADLSPHSSNEEEGKKSPELHVAYSYYSSFLSEKQAILRRKADRMKSEAERQAEEKLESTEAAKWLARISGDTDNLKFFALFEPGSVWNGYVNMTMTVVKHSLEIVSNEDNVIKARHVFGNSSDVELRFKDDDSQEGVFTVWWRDDDMKAEGLINLRNPTYRMNGTIKLQTKRAQHKQLTGAFSLMLDKSTVKDIKFEPEANEEKKE